MSRGFYEPKVGPLIVKDVKVYATDRVRIVWVLPDNSTHEESMVCPPPEEIEARRKFDARIRNNE